MKSESTSVEPIGKKGTFTENGRVFENLDHIEFEKLDKLVNGIRLLSKCDMEEFIEDKELFKMKIASPVSKNSTRSIYLRVYFLMLYLD